MVGVVPTCRPPFHDACAVERDFQAKRYKLSLKMITPTSALNSTELRWIGQPACFRVRLSPVGLETGNVHGIWRRLPGALGRGAAW